jgi:hypothetical protein
MFDCVFQFIHEFALMSTFLISDTSYEKGLFPFIEQISNSPSSTLFLLIPETI